MPLSDTSAKEKCERTVAWAQETIYELTVGDENCVQLDVEWYNEDTEDMVDCLENGIIPHAITDDRKDGYEI